MVGEEVPLSDEGMGERERIEALLSAAKPLLERALIRGPSRLYVHRSLSAELKVELWLKREDLLDEFGCGHKARKMDYLCREAMDRRATVLVTAVSLPSSQAVAAAAWAQALGLRAHIVYCGDEQRRPERLCGNYLLVSLLGATVTWRERSPWRRWREHLDYAVQLEERAGERPYALQPGLFRWPGFLGSVELGLELAAQLTPPDSPLHVVGAAGSGGSLLGVALGLEIAGMPASVHGACIGAPRKCVERDLGALRDHALDRLGVVSSSCRGSVVLHDRERCGGYGRASGALVSLIRETAARHGVLLDATYMAKAFACLRRLVGEGSIPRGERVVLLHSGGTVELLGGRGELGRRPRTSRS